jgi:cytochrome c oxidase subunit 3
MSAVATRPTTSHDRLRSNRLGLWLFFVTEVFMFGGLLVMRFRLWGNTRPDLDQTLGFIVTAILLASSFFMNRAEMAIAHDDRRNFIVSLTITGVLGVLFLVGVVGFEWRGHVRPGDGAYGAILYGMTGLHALHVLSGLVIIAMVGINGRQGRYSAHDHWPVEACALYWHLVDVVWVFLYPALYLVGVVVRH